MKRKIIDLIAEAARKAHEAGALTSDDLPAVALEEPKIGQHGDFATNFAMLSAKSQQMAPRQIAQAIVDHLEDRDNLLERVEIAGPGFINFRYGTAWLTDALADLVAAGERYGRTGAGQGRSAIPGPRKW